MAQKRNNNRPDRGRNRRAGNSTVVLTPEEKRRQLAKSYGIKPKTQQFIDLLHDNPKLSHTEAYLRTHKTESRITAGTAAHKLLKQPNVIGYRDSAVKKAKARIVTLVDSENENTALKAAQDILDRNEGKAIQKTENLSRTIEVKLDLTGVKLGAHHVPIIE